MTSYQPQAAFLDPIPDLGSVQSVHQGSFHATLNIIEARKLRKINETATLTV